MPPGRQAGRAQIEGGLLHRAQPGKRRGLDTSHETGQRVRLDVEVATRSGLVQRTRSPERAAAGLVEAAERTGGRERLDRVDRRAGAAHEVFDVVERVLQPFVVDPVEQRVA
jgi:hypothetical protein